jgi:uncharacterized protein YdbL (DUF1318 family)
MRDKRLALFISLLVMSVLIAGTTASAENIKARMKKRLPDIVALKKKGIIGESNRGYLAFVGKTRKKEALVAAENRDRRAVYQAIAEQQKVSVAVVEKRRALQIAKKARKGFWLQDEKGKWFKK